MKIIFGTFPYSGNEKSKKNPLLMEQYISQMVQSVLLMAEV